MKTQNRDKIREGRERKLAEVRKMREKPLFEFGKWSIIRYDDLNLQLIASDDSSTTQRFYSTIEGALRGLTKEIGFASDTLQEAIGTIDRLNSTIAALGM